MVSPIQLIRKTLHPAKTSTGQSNKNLIQLHAQCSVQSRFFYVVSGVFLFWFRVMPKQKNEFRLSCSGGSNSERTKNNLSVSTHTHIQNCSFFVRRLELGSDTNIKM